MSPHPRVAVVGAGAWGINLVRVLAELGALRVVVEPNAARAVAIEGAAPGVAVVPSLAEILPEVDAVVIATPVPTHFKMAGQAIDAGKHVFVEKPLVESLPEARNLAKRAEAENVQLMVGHMLLYQPAIAWLREQLNLGAIGRIRSIHQERLNHGRARSSENVLWSLGVHDIAVALYLLDRPIAAITATGHAHLTSRVEDDVYLHITYEDGVSSHMHVSWLWPEKRRRMTIVGSEGTFVYDEVNQTIVLHRKTIDKHLRNVDNGEEQVYAGDGQPLRLEMEHFLDCVARNRPAKSGPVHAIDSIRVLDAATRALRGKA